MGAVALNQQKRPILPYKKFNVELLQFGRYGPPYPILTHTRYIVNYSFINFTNPYSRFPYVIDRDSPFVAAFDIWRRDTPGILESSHPAQPDSSSVAE